MIRFHSPLSAFVSPEKIPLSMSTVSPGIHPNLEFHDHDYSELVIVFSGTARHIVKDKGSFITAGDVLSLHPGVFHAYDKAETLGIYNVLYSVKNLVIPLLDGWSMDFFKRLYPSEGHFSPTELAVPVLHLDKEQLEEATEMIQQLKTELNSCGQGSQLGAMMQFLTLALFLARCSPQQKSEQRLQFSIGPALAYMNQHWSENISVDKLALICCMSPRNFSRCFHISVGSPPIAYLQQLRLRQAAQKLIQTDLPISEIAESCGFYDCNFLGKQFRKQYQTTPRLFRARYRLNQVP